MTIAERARVGALEKALETLLGYVDDIEDPEWDRVQVWLERVDVDAARATLTVAAEPSRWPRLSNPFEVDGEGVNILCDKIAREQSGEGACDCEPQHPERCGYCIAGSAAAEMLKHFEPDTDPSRASGEAVAKALEKIDRWSQAYPLDVFPEPDMRAAAKLLEAGGLTLDAVSASNMRHVITRVRTILEPLYPHPPSEGSE